MDGGDGNGLAKILRITDPESDHLHWSQLLHRITAELTALQCSALQLLYCLAQLYCTALLHCGAIVCIAVYITEVANVSSYCAALHWFSHCSSSVNCCIVLHLHCSYVAQYCSVVHCNIAAVSLQLCEQK